MNNKLLLWLFVLLYLLLNIFNSYRILDITNIINNIYTKTSNVVNIKMLAGLGNRLMSFAGIIILSIIFKSKPFSIDQNILD